MQRCPFCKFDILIDEFERHACGCARIFMSRQGTDGFLPRSYIPPPVEGDLEELEGPHAGWAPPPQQRISLKQEWMDKWRSMDEIFLQPLATEQSTPFCVNVVGSAGAGKGSLINHLAPELAAAHVAYAAGNTDPKRVYMQELSCILQDIPGYDGLHTGAGTRTWMQYFANRSPPPTVRPPLACCGPLTSSPDTTTCSVKSTASPMRSCT